MKTLKLLLNLTLTALFLLTIQSCRKEGCTNPKATNYNPKADKDDGTCVLPTPPAPATTTEPKKQPSKPADSSKKDKATQDVASKFGKGSSSISSKGDDKSSKGTNDITYKLGAYGWVVDPVDPSDEIVVLVIMDEDDIVYLDAVLSDEDGYYEFNWTLTQDADADAPYREMGVFTYNDIDELICDDSDIFSYEDFDDIVSSTEGYYEVEDLEACDW